MSFPSLIIGGGISGITAAVELAEAGREVILVEKEAYLGGNVGKLNNYFPKLCPPSCGLEINFRRIRSNPRISYYTGAEVIAISGKEGNFRVKVQLAPAMINDSCTACGLCANACPEHPKAVFMKDGLAFPYKYTIDPDLCKGTSCGKCLGVCDFDAINLEATETVTELQAVSLILATGWTSFDASKLETYHYSEWPDVVTNMEFEAMMAACTSRDQKLLRPSDGKEPRKVAFVQCAGSRDEKHLPYCSSVCCAASVKHALTLAENYPGIESEIFYIDLRLTGRNEKLLTRADEAGQIRLTRGKVGRLHSEEDHIVLEVEDILAGKKRMQAADLVVLATGMVPVAEFEGLQVNPAGFLLDDQAPGIYPASTAKRPMDVSSSVKDASAVALKTLRILNE